MKLLCGNFDNKNFIYAIKSNESEWHYFDEQDSSIDKHNSLMTSLNFRISLLDKIQTIAITLSPGQLINYVQEAKFVFNGKELRTCRLYLTSRQLSR